jgi:predicted O-methyltransferase YrrM
MHTPTANTPPSRLLDPWQVARSSLLNPLRWYVNLRRWIEPLWYRARWADDAWQNLQAAQRPPQLTPQQRDRLATLERIAPSFVTAEHAQILFTCARLAPPSGDVVELGSDKGKSTVALAWGAEASASPCEVHAADPFVDSNATHRQERMDLLRWHLVAFGATNAIFHPLSSGEYRAQRSAPVRLLFVDAAHDYLNSRFDFLAWKPLIVPGGFIAAHDVDNRRWAAGTRKAFFECILSDLEFTLFCHVDNLAVAQRRGSPLAP